MEPEKLTGYGVKEVICVGQKELPLPAQQAEAILSVLPKAGEPSEEPFSVLFSHGAATNLVAAQVSVRAQLALATGVLDLVAGEEKEEGLRVRRSVYTGKAFETVLLKGKSRVLCLQKGAIAAEKVSDETVPALRKVAFETVSSEKELRTIAQHKSVQAVPLSDAKVVVSGGRGMQSADNWKHIEALAEALGAATACSKPVSDMEWRPHHEHVGQTGLKIAPKLYIAIGISGAIQHLAGISASQHILVINSDPDAPFFQAADYGIVGNALEILPQLTAAIKKMCG